MRIFLTKGSKLVENAEEQFLTEKEIQSLTEQNLYEIFNLEFVTSELQPQALESIHWHLIRNLLLFI